MMEFFRDTRIDFMKYRKVFGVLSAILVVLGLAAVFGQSKLNLGVDFAGGTQINLAFEEEPDIQQLRNLLEQGGVADAEIQRFGLPGDNQVLLRTPTVEGNEQGSLDQVVAILDQQFNPGLSGLDLNRVGKETLTSALMGADPDGKMAEGETVARAHYEAAAEGVAALRKADGLIHDFAALTNAVDLSPESTTWLQSNTSLGQYAVVGFENVWPQIGRELRIKGMLAVALSLIGMLIYIWLRFEFRFGIGALVAVFHDVLVVLGLFALLGYEFNLKTIAGFLTLVGYSVNDSVVIFDRVRENLRRHRRQRTVDVMNMSLNQTLSRTALTSGTTALVVLSLFVLGGDVIHGFAFVLLAGVIVGTYSSIFIACPVALLWERWMRSRREAKAAA